MMITFNIFKKKKGIYWTRTLIFYTILVPSLAVFLVRKEMDFDTNIIDDILICLIVGSLIYAFIVGSVGLVRYEPIKGRLEGFMVLNLNTIHIDYKVYHLKGKIHFLHLIDILNITDYNKIQQFKKEISYMS